MRLTILLSVITLSCCAVGTFYNIRELVSIKHKCVEHPFDSSKSIEVNREEQRQACSKLIEWYNEQEFTNSTQLMDEIDYVSNGCIYGASVNALTLYVADVERDTVCNVLNVLITKHNNLTQDCGLCWKTFQTYFKRLFT